MSKDLIERVFIVKSSRLRKIRKRYALIDNEAREAGKEIFIMSVGRKRKMVFLVLLFAFLVNSGLFLFNGDLTDTKYLELNTNLETECMKCTQLISTPVEIPVFETENETTVGIEFSIDVESEFNIDAEPIVINQEILDLREKYGNYGIIGYLSIEGTTIDYPVVQSADNAFYLDHDIYKNPDVAGWIFLDYQNDIRYDDKNMIIYGHNMRQNYRFHSIRYYTEKDYFNNHSKITFNTLYREQEWEIFTFFITDTRFMYIEIFLEDCDRWRDLLEQMKEKSIYDTGVNVSREDRVLLLSTCVDAGDTDMRYVLGAKLIVS